MTVCLFCRRPVVAGNVGIGKWHDGSLCHLACSDFLTQAQSDFKPIEVENHQSYDPAHIPQVWGFAGASFQEHDGEWMKLDESIKEKLYKQYLKYLNALLDHQERAIRAYCARHGLGEPKIVRELKQANQHMIEIFRMMTNNDLKPGDHLVMALPPRSQRHKHMAAQLTKNIATRMAARGVTFHSAFIGLDWSKPIAQAAVKLALNIQLWQQSIYKENMVYEEEDAKLRRVYGYTWKQLQRHQLFQWVIGHIRDKKMSPAELWEASRKYWSCHAFAFHNKRWWCLLITRDKYSALEKRKQNHYYCAKCQKVVMLQWCDKCDKANMFVKLRVVKGAHLNLNRRIHEDAETYMALWAFYCDMNPKQERTPWLYRSRFPEHLAWQQPDPFENRDEPD